MNADDPVAPVTDVRSQSHPVADERAQLDKKTIGDTLKPSGQLSRASEAVLTDALTRLAKLAQLYAPLERENSYESRRRPPISTSTTALCQLRTHRRQLD
jgi:hypothetical protein